MSAILEDMSVTFNFMQNKFQIGLGLLKLSLAQCGYWCLVKLEFDRIWRRLQKSKQQGKWQQKGCFFICVKFCVNICMSPTCALFSAWCLRLRWAPGAPAGANCSLYSAGRPGHITMLQGGQYCRLQHWPAIQHGPDTHCPHCGGLLRTLIKSITKVPGGLCL